MWPMVKKLRQRHREFQKRSSGVKNAKISGPNVSTVALYRRKKARTGFRADNFSQIINVSVYE